MEDLEKNRTLFYQRQTSFNCDCHFSRPQITKYVVFECKNCGKDVKFKASDKDKIELFEKQFIEIK